ncbi:MAG: asparagine synthase C-terminal domain-containing protein, partial [Nanoarchaeota archaeon]
EIKIKLKELLFESIKEEINFKNIDIKRQKIGVLFSGGIDSTLICFILKELNIDFFCYTSGILDENLEESRDIMHSKIIAKHYNFNHKITTINIKETEKYIKKIIKLLKTDNVITIGVGLSIYKALEEAKKDNINIVFSGIGSEEIFAGYLRHKNSKNINEECRNGLNKIYERDLIRDFKIANHFNIKLKLPFLNKKLVDYALKIPGKYKIDNNIEKKILRETAFFIGLDEKFCYRKKLGAQYGSKFDRAIQKLAKINNFKFKSEYLKNLYHKINN